jgi:hypothetical protein
MERVALRDQGDARASHAQPVMQARDEALHVTKDNARQRTRRIAAQLASFVSSATKPAVMRP